MAAATRVFLRSRVDTLKSSLCGSKLPCSNENGRDPSSGPPCGTNGRDGPMFWWRVKPETVVGWHRAGFRLYWRCRSRPRGGRHKLSEEVRTLLNVRVRGGFGYRSFLRKPMYSALASLYMGNSGSAFFQSVRNSSYDLRAASASRVRT